MKTFSKIILLSLILLILSVSCVNALELDDDDQLVGENNLEEISVEDSSLSEVNTEISSKGINQGVSSEETIEEQSSSNIDDEIIDKSLDDKEMLGESSDNERILGNSLNDDEMLGESSSNDILSSNVHQVSPSNYNTYFQNGYVNTNIVGSGDTIDLSGNFNRVNFTFTIPCSITSSKKNAYLNNCVVHYENVNSNIYSDVSNLRFTVDIEKHPSVYIVYSSHINVYNCNAYSTGANSNPTLLVGSSYCNIHHNVFETTYTGYMNMSWKRAGILLGESHYNNIYSNDVTIKDSNGIYLTTYGFEKSNYNNIYNNTIRSSAISEETGLPNPSAWAYGVHIMGDYNKAINNTIYKMYRGVDSEGSFNEIIGNDIYNLAGSYYEGNDGTDGGEYGIHASYDNTVINNTIRDSKITGSAIYMAVNCIATGNLIRNITGEHAFEFSISASNTLVENNFINMSSGNGIYVRGSMTNVTLSGNSIDTKNGTPIIVKMLSKATHPDNITIKDNCIINYKGNPINLTEVESKSNIILSNNSILITNASFFKAFDSNGVSKSIKSIDAVLLSGVFSDLPVDSIVLNNLSLLGRDSRIIDIPVIINSSNIRIENISMLLSDGIAFTMDNVENITFTGNNITMDCPNFAMVLNHSRISMDGNLIIVNGDSPAILNDNGSYIRYAENIIETLSDDPILSLNGSVVKITVYMLNDENYASMFDSNGVFLDDFDIEFGDTLKIANLTNKTIRIDIPLILTAYKDSYMNGSRIVLEGEASNTNVSNLRFVLNDDITKDFSFILIRDGVSDLIIKNNQFNVADISGNAKLVGIKLIGSDYTAKGNAFLGNVFNLSGNLDSIIAIEVSNQELDHFENIADGLAILNNNVSLLNNREDGLAYGVNVLNSNNLRIGFNHIIAISNNAFGIYLDRIKACRIENNFINVSGFNYQRFLDLIDSSSDFDIKDYVLYNLTALDAAVYHRNCQNVLSSNNQLYENNELVSIVHSNNPTLDIQNAVNSGGTVYLGNNLYSIKDSIAIGKSVTLIGGILLDNIDSRNNQLISCDDPLFIVSPKNTVNFIDMAVILDNNDLFALNLLKNSTNPLEVDYSTLNIKDNKFLKANGEVLGNSLTLLKSIAERPFFNNIYDVYLENNEYIDNMNLVKYYLFDDSNEINLHGGVQTHIASNDLTVIALDSAIYGNCMEYYEIRLLDVNGNPLANKLIHIAYNNVIYDYWTDSYGTVKFPLNKNSYGVHSFSISFLGDSVYGASFATGKLIVNKQKPVFVTSKLSYYMTANKYLKATLKDMNGNPIANKLVKFVLNGKSYTAYTNAKGLASLKIKINIAKTYAVTVSFAGDDVYSAVSSSFKVSVKKLKTKLVVKNRVYKKSKKVKKLYATLKNGKKAVKGKKIVFVVNKKKYTAKTNKKGVATVKVKVPKKKKTYKFTVKFAGDGTYLKSTKKAKLRIK